MSADPIETPDCCPGEPFMGDPNGLHTFDCPVYEANIRGFQSLVGGIAPRSAAGGGGGDLLTADEAKSSTKPCDDAMGRGAMTDLYAWLNDSPPCTLKQLGDTCYCTWREGCRKEMFVQDEPDEDEEGEE